MSLDDWILALHVLSAFAMVGAFVLFWIVIVAMRNVDTVEQTLAFAPVATVGNRVIGIGMVGTLVFGVWLAVSVGGYRLWDGWIVAALVLWALAAGLGGRGGSEYTKALTHARELRASGREGQPGELRALNRSPAGLRYQSISSVIVLALIVDMIWKPGA